MIFNAIRKFVRSRIARAANSFSKRKGLSKLFSESLDEITQEELDDLFQEDLANTFAKNPSVVKRDHPEDDYRVWEMYHSSNGNVYVYFPETYERRIYPK